MPEKQQTGDFEVQAACCRGRRETSEVKKTSAGKNILNSKSASYLNIAVRRELLRPDLDPSFGMAPRVRRRPSQRFHHMAVSAIDSDHADT